MDFHKFGVGQHALVWLHGLNSTWDHEGIGKQCKNALTDARFTIFCPQNPDQKDWSKNELATIKSYVIAQGPFTTYNITGHSQGGIGTISAINFHKNFWHTAGISSGKTGLTNYTQLLYPKIKIWHHQSDPVVGNSIFKFYTGMLAAGSDIQEHIYPGKVHAIEDTYSLTASYGYWQWLNTKL